MGHVELLRGALGKVYLATGRIGLAIVNLDLDRFAILEVGHHGFRPERHLATAIIIQGVQSSSPIA